MSRRWVIQAKDFPSAPGQWGSEVTIDLTPLLPVPSVTAVRLRKAFIPLLLQNIVTDNQTVTLTIGASIFAIAVPTGYYGGTSLMSTIKTALNTAMGATTYSIDITFDPNTYLTTIIVFDTAIPGPTAFALDTTTLSPDAPSILTMFGFVADPLVSATGTEVSDGPLNVITDRYLLVTCDQAKGAHGVIDILSNNAWHDGIISLVPIPYDSNSGDVIDYCPEDAAPWVGLVRGSTNGTITFRLSRADFPTMGSTQISWVMELEVRP